MRFLLDSNIWRYLLDADAVADVEKASRSSQNSIVIAPAVLFEAARTGDQHLRDALLSAMTRPAWKRLMPEMYSECEEIKHEVRRLRPEWLRRPPDLAMFKRIRHDWIRSKGGLWDRIKLDAEMLRKHDEEMLARARQQAQLLRDDARGWSPKWRNATLTKTIGSFSSPQPGWNGQPVEPWRVDGLNVFRVAATTPLHPMVDWLEGEVNIGFMLSQPEALGSFWLHEVELHNMPRHWIRWAFEFLQRMHRVTPGTPGDIQLGTYLVEVDVMLSADKILVSIAERCRRDAPFTMAESRAVSGATAAVDAVLKALSAR